MYLSLWLSLAGRLIITSVFSKLAVFTDVFNCCVVFNSKTKRCPEPDTRFAHHYTSCSAQRPTLTSHLATTHFRPSARFSHRKSRKLQSVPALDTHLAPHYNSRQAQHPALDSNLTITHDQPGARYSHRASLQLTTPHSLRTAQQRGFSCLM